MHPVTSLVVLALCACTVANAKYQHLPYPEYGSDLGSYAYCGRRSGDQCCAGRNDYCTVPILNTYCYCDIFCNRTVADCCPDFWELCIGISPPPGALTPPPTTGLTTLHKKDHCVHNGIRHSPGASIKVNCNNCSCIAVPENGEYNWNCTQEICLIREEIIRSVNQRPELGWRASNYSFLWGKTLAEGIKYRLGTFKPSGSVDRMSSIRVITDYRLPHEFDARKHWVGLIHGIRDQGDCGSSWAVSTADVASDRLSIHSRGSMRESLSAQHILSCSFDNQQGCSGGHFDRAWWYLRRSGVVRDDCYPYTSGYTSTKGTCLIPRRRYRSPSTMVSCPVGQGQSRLYQATPTYRIDGEQDIMKEIFQNGPVQAVMEVREDFFMYQRGVYQFSLPQNINSNHRQSGYHAVKIIGWGTDTSSGQPKKYWLAANSWGRQWGEDGYFRILRGVNEGNIESVVVGAWAKVNGRQIINRLYQQNNNISPVSSGSQPESSGVFSGSQPESSGLASGLLPGNSILSSGSQPDNNNGISSGLLPPSNVVSSGSQPGNNGVVSSGSQLDNNGVVSSGSQLDNNGVVSSGSQLDNNGVVSSGSQLDNNGVVSSGSQTDNNGVVSGGSQLDNNNVISSGSQSENNVISSGVQPDKNGIVSSGLLPSSGSSGANPKENPIQPTQSTILDNKNELDSDDSGSGSVDVKVSGEEPFLLHSLDASPLQPPEQDSSEYLGANSENLLLP